METFFVPLKCEITKSLLTNKRKARFLFITKFHYCVIMGIYNLINKLSRVYNKIVMLILALVIFFLLLANSFDATAYSFDSPQGVTLLTLWSLFTIISFIYTLNGILLNSAFHQGAKKQLEKGKPVTGIRGYSDLVSSLSSARNYSILITLASVISLALFVSAIALDFSFSDAEDNVRSLMTTLAVTFAFITISVMFVVEYPEESSFSPGGLISFYEPDTFPMTLDNLLGDVFLTYVDPATYMDVDEWQLDIMEKLNPNFENDESRKTRLERAREKILLLAYMHNSNEKLVTKDVVQKELLELFGENLDEFMHGKGTGLTFEEILKIVRRIEDKAPEPFRLVDRLMIALTDDYEHFKEMDTYITVSAKTNQGSVRESAGILVFFLNKTENALRQFHVSLRSDRQTVHPYDQSILINLDPQSDPLPDAQPPIISEGGEDDVIGILSDILQVGDAVWFRIKPSSFGFKVVTVQGEEVGEHGMTFGESIEMKFTKSLSFYVKAYLPKISGAAGLAIPVLQGFLGL